MRACFQAKSSRKLRITGNSVAQRAALFARSEKLALKKIVNTLLTHNTM